MNDELLKKKNELLNWLLSLESEETILRLLEIKKDFENKNQVSETQAEYALKDDFDERFAKGIPHDEMKRRTVEYIQSLNWKK